MATTYTSAENCAVVRAWLTVTNHFEDLGKDIDQTSDAWWNRVIIVFVALDGNCNSRSLKLVEERFEEIFIECEAFKKELKVVRESLPNMLGAIRLGKAYTRYAVLRGKEFEFDECYRILEGTTFNYAIYG